ncbi:hypothetical protein VIGAN_04169500 [Vigna angularis var. angularis]|uniref:Uncharacterized protein n=1 Tax=Vigna angularis var. angularis TaxID=157739 RepID=A0A0S3RUT3_PHAAN|nr:hypothetical protein VIGAN_04169500 [Vigna angularis var. angularis]
MTSIDQHPDGAVVVRAQPISVVKDPIFLNRLKRAFHDQLRNANMRALKDLQHGEHPLVVPASPMVPQTQRKLRMDKDKGSATNKEKGTKFAPEVIMHDERWGLAVSNVQREWLAKGDPLESCWWKDVPWSSETSLARANGRTKERAAAIDVAQPAGGVRDAARWMEGSRLPLVEEETYVLFEVKNLGFVSYEEKKGE